MTTHTAAELHKQIVHLTDHLQQSEKRIAEMEATLALLGDAQATQDFFEGKAQLAQGKRIPLDQALKQ